MDVIIIGIYSLNDMNKLDEISLLSGNLEIVWDYEKYNVEAIRGIKLLEKSYGLIKTGILVEKDRDTTFSSFPLICEISESYFEKSERPKLFRFFDLLIKCGIVKMIIAFADEWDTEVLVKAEKCDFQLLEKRLDNLFVWCDSLKDLIHKTQIRDDYHPLVLEVE